MTKPSFAFTGKIVITCDTPDLPEEINFGYEKINAEQLEEKAHQGIRTNTEMTIETPTNSDLPTQPNKQPAQEHLQRETCPRTV